MLAMQALMASGIQYDGSDPVLKNVIFDIEREAHELNLKMNQLHKRIENCRQNLNELNDYKTIELSNMSRYNNLVEEISDLLFDDITYFRITNPQQMEWKEYFHCLYDLVVFAYHSDRTHLLQMINETYKYYESLDKPTELSPRDPLYVDFKSCADLFAKLKDEHATLVIPRLFKKVKRHFEIVKKKRLHYMQLQAELENIVQKRMAISNITRWATTSSS
jgi:hypothetical protein